MGELQANPLTGLPATRRSSRSEASPRRRPSSSVTPTSITSSVQRPLRVYAPAIDPPFTAEVLTEAVAKAGCRTDFVGPRRRRFRHRDQTGARERICQRVASRFDEEVVRFLCARQLEARRHRAVDRQGRSVFIPLIAVAIAVMEWTQGDYEHPDPDQPTAATSSSSSSSRGPGSRTSSTAATTRADTGRRGSQRVDHDLVSAPSVGAAPVSRGARFACPAGVFVPPPVGVGASSVGSPARPRHRHRFAIRSSERATIAPEDFVLEEAP